MDTNNLSRDRACNKPYALAFVIIISLLSGCAVQTPTNTVPPVSGGKTSIPSSWEITAKLGIASPENNGSITLQWQQDEEHYRIQTSAPLGQGRAVLTGSNKSLLIERPNKPSVYSKNPELLLMETLGWSLPLSQLRYWSQGRAAPTIKVQEQEFSPTGNLLYLKQEGWSLKYSRYKQVSRWTLPHKIVVSQGETKLTLIIKEWLFTSL